jgi:hypothetical protein
MMVHVSPICGTGKNEKFSRRWPQSRMTPKNGNRFSGKIMRKGKR